MVAEEKDPSKLLKKKKQNKNKKTKTKKNKQQIVNIIKEKIFE